MAQTYIGNTATQGDSTAKLPSEPCSLGKYCLTCGMLYKIPPLHYPDNQYTGYPAFPYGKVFY